MKRGEMTAKDTVVLGIIIMVSIALSVLVTIVEYFGEPGNTVVDFAVLFGLMWGFYRLGRTGGNGD